MTSFEPGLYVRIKPLPGKSPPNPLDHGFALGTAYRVLGLNAFSETSETYLMLANEQDEIVFVSTRHVRVAGVHADKNALRFPIGAEEGQPRGGNARAQRVQPAGSHDGAAESIGTQG